jgi:kynureninase
MAFQNTREYAKSQDDVDLLKAYREQFFVLHEDKDSCAYFCGNSLGLQPKSARDAIV